MSPQETALDFVRRFAAGDVDGLARLLAPDLHLSGPRLEVESRADYLEALRDDPPEPTPARVLEVSAEQNGEVFVLYEYRKPEGVLLVRQWFNVEGGVILRSRIDFSADHDS